MTRAPCTSGGALHRLRALRNDRGAGAVLAIALVMTVVVIGLAAVSLAAALSTRQRVIGAADLAALAAADAASGAIGGVPCQVASGVARANGARLVGCEADGLIVTVTVVGWFAGIPIDAHARAGPPWWMGLSAARSPCFRASEAGVARQHGCAAV